jgi:hypothetical protein
MNNAKPYIVNYGERTNVLEVRDAGGWSDAYVRSEKYILGACIVLMA